MKAITLTQPWATLIAIRAKRIETRGWATTYRGPLAIHAAAGLGPVGGRRGLRALVEREPFFSALADITEHTADVSLVDAIVAALPLGAIVAVCRLVSIHRITEAGIEGFRPQPPANEIALGNYAAGRHAWVLLDARPLPAPIPARGALGLWNYDGEAL